MEPGAGTPGLQWIVFLVLVVVNVVSCVDGDHGESSDEDKDKDECHVTCEFGCCGEDQECCVSPVPSNTVQIIGVTGTFLVGLVLFVLCVVRYKCIRKLRGKFQRQPDDAARGREGSRPSRAVFALNVPPQNVGRLLNAALASMHWSNDNTSLPPNTGTEPVQPPPYTQRDPLTAPVYTWSGGEGGSGSGSGGEVVIGVDGGDLPPAYADVTKDCVIETTHVGEGLNMAGRGSHPGEAASEDSHVSVTAEQDNSAGCSSTTADTHCAVQLHSATTLENDGDEATREYVTHITVQ